MIRRYLFFLPLLLFGQTPDSPLHLFIRFMNDWINLMNARLTDPQKDGTFDLKERNAYIRARKTWAMVLGEADRYYQLSKKDKEF